MYKIYRYIYIYIVKFFTDTYACKIIKTNVVVMHLCYIRICEGAALYIYIDMDMIYIYILWCVYIYYGVYIYIYIFYMMMHFCITR